MKSNDQKQILNAIRSLFALAGISVLLILGGYLLNFAKFPHFELSKDPADWGTFGDFFGGTLNPIFSFLGFMGLVITISLQMRQLRATRQQSTHEEIQRVLASTALGIDNLLATEPHCAANTRTGTKLSLGELVSACGTHALRPQTNESQDWFEWATGRTLLSGLKSEIQTPVGKLNIEISCLAWALQRYRADDGATAVIEYYQYRYRALVGWLHAAEMLPPSSRVTDIFDPVSAAEHLRVNNGPARD